MRLLLCCVLHAAIVVCAFRQKESPDDLADPKRFPFSSEMVSDETRPRIDEDAAKPTEAVSHLRQQLPTAHLRKVETIEHGQSVGAKLPTPYNEYDRALTVPAPTPASFVSHGALTRHTFIAGTKRTFQVSRSPSTAFASFVNHQTRPMPIEAVREFCVLLNTRAIRNAVAERFAVFPLSKRDSDQVRSVHAYVYSDSYTVLDNVDIRTLDKLHLFVNYEHFGLNLVTIVPSRQQAIIYDFGFKHWVPEADLSGRHDAPYNEIVRFAFSDLQQLIRQWITCELAVCAVVDRMPGVNAHNWSVNRESLRGLREGVTIADLSKDTASLAWQFFVKVDCIQAVYASDITLIAVMFADYYNMISSLPDFNLPDTESYRARVIRALQTSILESEGPIDVVNKYAKI